MTVFAHHAEAFLAIEIYGRPFPDGMTEHGLVLGFAAAVAALTVYGAFAAVRDLLGRRVRLAAAGG